MRDNKGYRNGNGKGYKTKKEIEWEEAEYDYWQSIYVDKKAPSITQHLNPHKIPGPGAEEGTGKTVRACRTDRTGKSRGTGKGEGKRLIKGIIWIATTPYRLCLLLIELVIGVLGFVRYLWS